MTDLQRFSQNPDPAKLGQDVTICYNFDGLENVPAITASLDWDPAGLLPDVLTLTPTIPCQTFTVPVNAKGCIIVDDAGYSPDFVIVIKRVI